jgi:hypothetical protein
MSDVGDFVPVAPGWKVSRWWADSADIDTDDLVGWLKIDTYWPPWAPAIWEPGVGLIACVVDRSDEGMPISVEVNSLT